MMMMSEQKKVSLADVSIHAWIKEHAIRTEKGDVLNFRDHPFLFDIYSDFSPFQAIMKPAQIGASTMMNVKPFWMMEKLGVDIIYTLPTDADVIDFVGSKTNRMIAQNPYLQELTKDRDTIEQKACGDSSLIYYRGTWTKKAAMMVPSDVNIHDEVDASKQEIIADYETRLKHSNFKWRWYFSHPSVEGMGIHKLFCLTDQKHWFIVCPACNYEQVMTWPESIDRTLGKYICKKCKQPTITDDVRRRGRWKPTVKTDGVTGNLGKSGYWISSMMCPWVPATEIIDAFETKDPEYFNTKVLGLPYSGGGTKVTREMIVQNCTPKTNSQRGKIVIGVDTGLKIHLVMGNREGLFYYSETGDYAELEKLLRDYPTAVAVIDQGGDLITPRKLREKYPGRIFLCYFRKDKKAMQLVSWGEGDEEGKVVADRNRCIQLVVDEFTDKRLPLQGTEFDWDDYAKHWGNVYRIREEDSLGMLQSKWERSGPDHLCLATTYWRIGMTRFGQGDGEVLGTGAPSFGINVSPGVSLDAKGNVPASSITRYVFPQNDERDPFELY